MEPQFKKIFQIGIIVEDVDASVKHFEDDFGMGPWEVRDFSNEVDPFKEMTINGEKVMIKNRMAFMKAYGMEIELIQPISDSAYKRWLDEHGPGIHHIAVLTNDPYEEVIKKAEELSGKKAWLHGECKPIGMDFTYLDLTKELGLFVEVYNEDKSKSPGNDF